MNNDLMIEKYYECIGNDLKEEGEKELAMQWLGVWIEAWRACERTLSPSQVAADLQTARRGLAEYRATIERMVAEKEEMAGKLVREAASLTHWLKIGQDRGRELRNVYGRIAAIEWKSTRCPVCHQLTGSSVQDGHADNCLWLEAALETRTDPENA
jgi:hypothetical protein